MSDFLYMKSTETEKLIICGKANQEKTFAQVKKKFGPCKEFWALGTDPREGADAYFEFHNRPSPHREVIRTYPEEKFLKDNKYLFNNSISILLYRAFKLGFEEIIIVGAPMDSVKEYIEERPALAYDVGYITGQGVKVFWDGMPQNKNYGQKPAKK